MDGFSLWSLTLMGGVLWSGVWGPYDGVESHRELDWPHSVGTGAP